MPRRWRFAPYDEAAVRDLCRDVRISPLAAQVLLARGYSDAISAGQFLNSPLTALHDPDELPGVSQAADRIVAAVREGRRVTIYGDYDVDGVTATSILWHCLKLENANVGYYIPCRFEEGYGLNAEALQSLHEEDPRQLVVSVDCGITAVAEAKLARELGLELIITDHHQMDSELPDAACLVHPRLPGSQYPFADLCGAGVAFKLAWAICKRLGDGEKATPRMREFLKGAVGLAAIGTVADVVPLHGENRILVRHGLQELRQRSAAGLRALLQVSGIESDAPLQADDDIGFKIGPRINAAGRLGQARLAVELLTTDNAERAMTLAKYLDELNKNRRTVETRMVKRAKSLVADNPEWNDHRALVLAHHDWHPGVMGIVANRIAEHFEKPTVMIALAAGSEIGQGSARSFAGCDLHGMLAACAGHLVSFGGHRAAAGLKIRIDAIDGFRTEFVRCVAEAHRVTDEDLEWNIDAEVRFADVTRNSVLDLDRLGPFGQGNPRPLFAATRVELAGPPQRMGEGGNHLNLRLRHYGATLRAVAFGRGDWADELERHNGPIDVCFAPVINRFRGQERVELMLKDWQPAK
jgi:single-stranded-DNA-specific exonuclease